jgi:hypothetical protein
MYSGLRAIDPFLVPTWRHDYVSKLISQRPIQRCRSNDDPWVKEYRTFLLNRQKSEDVHERKWLKDNPHLFYAVKLFESAEEFYELPFILESRIISGDTYENIAAKLKISPETVDWYERLFFNVRDFMGSRDWVFRNVLLPSSDRLRAVRAIREAEEAIAAMHSGKSAPAPNIVSPFLDPSIKFFAYYGGPVMCDLVLTGFDGTDMGNVTDASKFLEDQFKNVMRIRGLQLARVMPLNRYNAIEFTKLNVALQQVAADTQGRGGSKAAKDLEDRLRDIIPMACLTIGMDPLALSEKSSFIDEANSGGVELDATELVAAGAGKVDLPDLKKFASVYTDRAKEA